MKVLVADIETLIDEIDLDPIRDYNWCLNNGYLYGVNGKYIGQLFHRMIAERMGLDLSNEIDHIDGDILNNKRNNLRSATHSQNMFNRKKQKNNTSGYRGVSWHKRAKRWSAYIRYQKKLIHLGYFDGLIQAAKTRDRAALKYHGEFVRLNFPRSDYSSDLSSDSS